MRANEGFERKEQNSKTTTKRNLREAWLENKQGENVRSIMPKPINYIELISSN